MKRWLAALLLGFAASGAGARAAGDETLRFLGYAYELDSNRYLYTEAHEQRVVDGTWVGGSTIYYARDGSEFGRKTLDFTHDRFVPTYRMDMTREGYSEAITDAGATIVMMRAARGGEPETESVSRNGLMTADSGLPKLLRAHFDALMKGETLAFRVVAPSRLDTYKFRVRRIEDTTFENAPAVRFQADMDSMLKLFAGPLVFTYDPKTLKLLEFRGTSNVRNPANGELYKVRLAYYSAVPKDAMGVPATMP